MSDTVGGTTGSYGRDTARGCNRNATWRWSRRRARIWKVWRRVSTHKAASRVGRRRVQAVRDPAEIRPCRRGSEPPQFTTGSQPCFSVDSKQGRSAVGVCNWAPARADVWRGVPLGDFPALSIESWEAAVHGPRRGTVVARWWNRRARPFDAPKDACLAGLRRVWCGRHVTRPTNAGKRKERGKPRRCDRRCRGRSSVQKTHGPREPVHGMRSPVRPHSVLIYVATIHRCSIVASFARIRGRIRAIVSTRTMPPSRSMHAIQIGTSRVPYDPYRSFAPAGIHFLVVEAHDETRVVRRLVSSRIRPLRTFERSTGVVCGVYQCPPLSRVPWGSCQQDLSYACIRNAPVPPLLVPNARTVVDLSAVR